MRRATPVPDVRHPLPSPSARTGRSPTGAKGHYKLGAGGGFIWHVFWLGTLYSSSVLGRSLPHFPPQMTSFFLQFWRREPLLWAAPLASVSQDVPEGTTPLRERDIPP